MSFEKVEWEPLSSWKEWLYMHILLIVVNLVDLNAFLLKLFLWIPTEHDINVVRLFLMGALAVPSAKQYYLYIKDPLCKKLGSQCWIFVLIVVLELAIIFKVAPELPDVPTVKWSIIWLQSFVCNRCDRACARDCTTPARVYSWTRRSGLSLELCTWHFRLSCSHIRKWKQKEREASWT